MVYDFIINAVQTAPIVRLNVRRDLCRSKKLRAQRESCVYEFKTQEHLKIIYEEAFAIVCSRVTASIPQKFR
jgi:hypothetical protein